LKKKNDNENNNNRQFTDENVMKSKGWKY